MIKKEENSQKQNLKNYSSNINNSLQLNKKDNITFKKTKPSYSEKFKDKLKYVSTNIGLSSGSEGSYSNLYKNAGIKIYNDDICKHLYNIETNNKINSFISNRFKLNNKSRNYFSPNKNSDLKKSKTQISKSNFNSPRREINYNLNNKKNTKIDLNKNENNNNKLNNETIDKDEIIKLQIKSNDDKIRNLLLLSENNSLNFDKQIEDLYKELFEVNEIKEVDEEEEGSLMGSKNPSKQLFNVNNNQSENILLLNRKKSEKILKTIHDLNIIDNNKEINNLCHKEIKKKCKSKEKNNSHNINNINPIKENSKDNSLIKSKRKKSHHRKSKTIENLYKENTNNKTLKKAIYENSKIEYKKIQKSFNKSFKENNKSNLIKKSSSNESIETFESSQKPNKIISEKEFVYKNEFKICKSNNNSFHSFLDNEKENSNLIYKSKQKSLDKKCFNGLFKNEIENDKKLFLKNHERKKRKNEKIKNIKKQIPVPVSFKNNNNRPQSVNKISSRNYNF